MLDIDISLLRRANARLIFYRITAMLEQKIIDIITPSLSLMGYDIVQVSMYSDVKKRLLILIDKLDESPISISDCEKASHQISAILDVELDEVDEYILEVSSAGIDRPLIKIKDYIRFVGREAKLELFEAIDDQKKFRGKIIAVDGDQVSFDSYPNDEKTSKENKNLSISFDKIKKAKLLLSDDLTKKNKEK